MCAHFFDFFEELSTRSLRPVKQLMAKACRKVHPKVGNDEIVCLVDRVLAVISFIRAKAKSSSSGKKLSPRVRELVKLYKKLSKGDPSRSPSPTPEKRQASSSSSLSFRSASFDGAAVSALQLSERDSIFAAYGLEISKQAGNPKVLKEAVLQISDSETDTVPHREIALEWFDSETMCQKRRFSDGGVESATMRQGSSGFLEATFEGESSQQLEVPNAVMLPVAKVMK